MPAPKDSWDKLKVGSAAFAAIAVPLAVAAVGHLYTRAIKEREVQSDLMKVALQILGDSARPETKNLRTWATRVIDSYSGVPLSTAEKVDLVTTISLPNQTVMPTDFIGEYAVTDDEVSLSVVIHHGQMGSSVAFVDGILMAEGGIAKVRLGTGAGLKGKHLRLKTLVVDINSFTNKVSVDCSLSGGKRPELYTLESSVERDGDAAIFKFDILFR